MLDYSIEPLVCRRKLMLNLLGEEFDPKKCNKGCDNCRKNVEILETDLTFQAKLVMNMLQELAEKHCDIMT